MRATQLVEKCSRGTALLTAGILFSSLLVITSAVPVAADGSGAGPAPSGQRTGENVFSFVPDDNDCATYYSALETPVEVSSWNATTDSWSLGTPPDFPTDELLSNALTLTDIFTGTVRDADNQPVPNAVVGTLMLSNLPGEDSPSPEIVAATCAVTNVDGEFSVRALNIADNFAAPGVGKLANLGVSPPLTSGTLATPHLGSKSVRLTSATATTVNFILENANVNWGSYVLDEEAGFDDVVTFPMSAYCVQDPTPTTGVTVCGMSRGMSVSTQVTHIDSVSYDMPYDDFGTSFYLRLYLDESVDLPLWSSFEVAGFDGPMAAANGRWANAMSSDLVGMLAGFMNDTDEGSGDALLDGVEPGDIFVDVPFGPPGVPIVGKTPVTGVTFETEIWRNALTVPVSSAATINITAYHRHLGPDGDVVSSFRYIPVETTTGGSSAYVKITSGVFEDGFADGDFLTIDYHGGGGGGGGCDSAGDGNYSGIVLTDLEPATPFDEGGCIYARPFDENAYGEGNAGWAWEPDDGALQSEVAENGHFDFEVPDGTTYYQLQFVPFSSQVTPESTIIAKITVAAGEVTEVGTCATFSLSPEAPTLDGRCTDGDDIELTDGKYLFFAPPANFFAEVLLPDGSSLDGETRSGVSVGTPVAGEGNWYFYDGSNVSTNDDGKLLLHLTDGSYQLSIRPPEDESYATIRVYLKVSTVGGVQTIERCTVYNEMAGSVDEMLDSDSCEPIAPTNYDSPLELQFSTGDLVGQVVGAEYFWVEVQKKNPLLCADCYQHAPGASGSANSSGVFALTFATAGDYKLILNPNDLPGATRSEVLVEVEIAEDETKTLTVSQNGVPVLPDDEGVYVFIFNTANFVIQVTDPLDNEVANSWVNLQSLEASPSGRFEFRRWIDAARTDADGNARMSLNTTGYYKLVASNPTAEPYPELAAFVKVEAGSPSTFYRCSDYQSQPIDRNDDDEVDEHDALECEDEESDTPFVMQFEGASFRGQVTGYANFWVELQQRNEAQCEDCYEWRGGTVANQSGIFGLNFEEIGTYRLVLNPPWNDTTGATRTEVTVVVSNGVGDDFSYVVTRGGVTVSPTISGTYVFTLSSANFAAALKKSDDSAEPYPNASFERWNANTQQFEWSSTWANGNASGQFSASLSDGTWKITARPGFQSEGTATPAVVYAIVADGVTSKVATSRTCVDAPDCDGIEPAGSPPRYTLTLGSPNFTGFVGVSVGIPRDPETGQPSTVNNTVSFSWIEVQAWNKFELQYRWSPEVSGVNISSTGRFATTLPAGNATSNPDSQYLVIVNPRPQDAGAGRSRGSFRVKVNDEGAVICEADYEFCDDGEEPDSGRFDLYLSGANLTGTVTAGENPVPFSNVRAERWNGQWFNWVNLWAQTGTNGGFALNLETEGTYKLTAEAPTWNNSFATYANVSLYVRFDGDEVCQVDDQNDTECNGDSVETLELDVALAGANVSGSVSSAAGAVRNGWVNVMRYNSTVGWWEWVTGVPVRNSGSFSLSLAPSQDGDSDATGVQQRFRLDVMPPWGNSSLTRKEVQLWVGAVGQDEGVNYYRVCSESTLEGCPGDDETEAKSSSDTLAVLLTSGNVTGTVTSDGTNGMANAWINVEKWMTPSWAREEMWQWVEVFANSNQAGIYNLDLEAQGVGYYRITANPGWNNPDNLTRTSKIVYQDGSADVCEVTDFETDDPSCSAASNPYELDIQLAGANLAGTLKNGSANVGFAWVGLLRERNNAGLGDGARSNTWYEWLGGANTNASGTFGLRIESDGRYQLEVNPPWSTALTRFSVYLLAEDSDDDGIEPNEIRICSSKSQSNADCRDDGALWSAGSNSELSFPAANVAIRVCSKDGTGTACTGVPNAWVNAFSGYEWVGGANTNSAGIARFSLPDGNDYRFEANPNWANPDGTRVETGDGIEVEDGDLVLGTVTIDGAVIAATSDQIDMRLGSPNVTGVVYYLLGDDQTAMPWAYVGVRKNINTDGVLSYEWLPGASADGSGRFRLALADGDYTLTAYPNPSVADRAPASISVEVDGDDVTCSGAALFDTCSIDFDAAVKNIIFDMTDMGTFTRTLYVYDSANTLVTTVSKAPVGGIVSVSFALPVGTYRLRVQALNTIATDGSTSIVDFSDSETGSACRSFTGLEVADVEGVPTVDAATQTLLDAWAAGFVGNDATTGLECKP